MYLLAVFVFFTFLQHFTEFHSPRALLNCKSPDGSEDPDAKKALLAMESGLFDFLPEEMWESKMNGVFVSERMLERTLDQGLITYLSKIRFYSSTRSKVKSFHDID